MQYLTQTFKIGGDGGNEVTLPQHVWTDSSCSSNALCPLGESRACQQDGYIKKKLQKRKKRGSDSNLILQRLKEKKRIFSTINCERRAVCQLQASCLCHGWGWVALASETREEEDVSAGPQESVVPGMLIRAQGMGLGEKGWQTQDVWSSGYHVASILEKLVFPR